MLLGRLGRRVSILVLRALLKPACVLPLGRENRIHIAHFRRFLHRHNRFPSRTCPAYNDKLYLLKTDGSLLDPLRQFVTDKEHVKTFVAAEAGPEFVIRTLRVLRSMDDINSFVLPETPCVIKPTHWSGRVMFVGEEEADVDRRTLRRWMDPRKSYESVFQEQNYRFLAPKLIVEEFLGKNAAQPPMDYKVFCFRGQPGFIQVDRDRFADHTQSFYDLNWNRLPFRIKGLPSTKSEKRPKCLNEIIELSKRLSRHFSFVRVDLYVDGINVRVGELTNLPNGGNSPVIPPEAEYELGRYFG